MTYQALYRTYRPRRFSEVVGQEHVVRTLLNSVRQGRVGHAYLFSGPRGTGKTTIARLLARVINCENPQDGEPCGNCPRCSGAEENLGILEIDAASHGSVDDMRQLVAQVSQVPMSGGMMVYIIDEVHMLSKEAFNAFLKTLEEPPPHAVFVLATTEPGKLLQTIHSRCQHFAFRRLPIETIAEHVGMICKKEGVAAEDSALRLIARAGDGSVRDSISVLEQAIAYEPDGLTLDGVRNVLGIPDRVDIRRLGGCMLSGDPGGVSTFFNDLVESGREPGKIIADLLGHLRDILFATLDIKDSELELLPEEELRMVREQSDGMNVEEIHRAISYLAEREGKIKFEDEAALLVEVALLRIASKFAQPSGSKVTEKKGEIVPQIKEEKEEKEETEVPAAVKTEEKQKPAGHPSLTGGVSLKRQAKSPESVPAESKVIEKPDKNTTVVTKAGDEPKIKDPEWSKILDKVRAISVANYILLRESEPDPSPSEWVTGDGEFLNLVLKFPYEWGFMLTLINQPSVLNRINTSLEEAVGRSLEVKLARKRGSARRRTGDQQVGMVNGEGPVGGATAKGGPSLFPGASREAPQDPDLKKIHNLIVDEFPNYTIKQEGAK